MPLKPRPMPGKAAAADDAADRAVDGSPASKSRSAERQLLSIYDDRIQTEQQLATVYGKWSAQVLLQHRIVLHLILQSLALIFFILICMVLCDALVRRLMANPALDRRQTQTLRSFCELGFRLLASCSFCSWSSVAAANAHDPGPGHRRRSPSPCRISSSPFSAGLSLMGKNGIHVGDWVEINGVGGEVTEIGLISTTLLETGNLADKGLPTGRRITFMNRFAIRGQYFNFSTTGQWMWDEITVSCPRIRRSRSDGRAHSKSGDGGNQRRARPRRGGVEARCARRRPEPIQRGASGEPAARPAPASTSRCAMSPAHPSDSTVRNRLYQQRLRFAAAEHRRQPAEQPRTAIAERIRSRDGSQLNEVGLTPAGGFP